MAFVSNTAIAISV